MKKWVIALWVIQSQFTVAYAGAAQDNGISAWLNGLLDLNHQDEGQAVAETGSTHRDPFAVSALMLQLVKGLNPTQAEDFTSGGESRDKVPILRLSGFLTQEDDSKIALLTIDGSGTYLVREGDTLSLQSLDENTVLKIESIHQQSISISIGTLGQRVIVR